MIVVTYWCCFTALDCCVQLYFVTEETFRYIEMFDSDTLIGLMFLYFHSVFVLNVQWILSTASNSPSFFARSAVRQERYESNKVKSKHDLASLSRTEYQDQYGYYVHHSIRHKIYLAWVLWVVYWYVGGCTVVCYDLSRKYHLSLSRSIHNVQDLTRICFFFPQLFSFGSVLLNYCSN